jgi:hypothetical protein
MKQVINIILLLTLPFLSFGRFLDDRSELSRKERLNDRLELQRVSTIRENSKFKKINLNSSIDRLESKIVTKDYILSDEAITVEISRDILVNEDRNIRDRTWFSSDDRFIKNERLYSIIKNSSKIDYISQPNITKRFLDIKYPEVNTLSLSDIIDNIWINFYKELPRFVEIQIKINESSASYPSMLLKEIENKPEDIELLKKNLNKLKKLFK